LALAPPIAYLLAPLCLLVGSVLILMADATLPKRESGSPLSWWLALLFVLVSGASSFVVGRDDATQVFAVLAYDPFTAYVWRLLLATLGLVVLISQAYISHNVKEAGFFYAALLLFGFGALVLTACTNTIMLILAVDFLSIVGYVLTGYLHDDKRSTEAALKYLIYGSAVSAVMAFGLSWLYGITGTADYELTARGLAGEWVWAASRTVEPLALIPMVTFVLAGFAFKIGSAPFHQWLPDAFEGAPTPVTASLAIIPKVAGFAALVRLTLVMLPETLTLGVWWRWPLVAFLSVMGMFLGNLIGIWQTNVKRLMAYSGIAQVGYALIAVAVATERSLTALLLYLTVYAIAEMGAFAAITVMSTHARSDDLADYRGLHHRAPILAAAMIISILSLFGMPGTGGFIGKLWLFTAALDAGRGWLIVIAAVNSIISVAYYWKVIQATFVHSDPEQGRIRVPNATMVAVTIAVFTVLALGVYPNVVLRWAEAAVHGFFQAG
jgi:NADH-quinone oxidoreductase subunit N